MLWIFESVYACLTDDVSIWTDIAWGRFADYRPVLTSTKLDVSLRLRLFVAIVGSTMLHGSSAWFAVDQVKRMINGVNSKLTSQITKRTIHQEAKHPSYDIISAMLQRRWSYLGHILRMDEDRTVRRFLLKLSPTCAPFTAGADAIRDCWRGFDSSAQSGAVERNF